MGNSIGRSISVISTASLSVVDTIPIGDRPFGVAVSPDSSRVYVVTNNSGSLKVIQTSDNTIIGDFPIVFNPQAVAVHPSGEYVYISEAAFAGSLEVFRTSDNTVISIPTTGANPRGVSVSPDGNFVYVSLSFTRDVDVVNANTNMVVDTIFDVSDRQSLFCSAISPDGETLYVANAPNGNEVSVIRLSDKSVTSIAVDGDTIGVDVTPDGRFVYVTGSDANQAFVINSATNNIVDTVSVGFDPSSCGKFITQRELAPIPTLSEWGLIAMAGILGIVGFMVIRRRKVTA